MTTPVLRPELAPLPERMKSLPVDSRGYPVPWFVQWVTKETCQICKGNGQSTDELTGCADDKCPGCGGVGTVPVPCLPSEAGAIPEFRAMDQGKRIQAIRKRLCWVCGGKLGVNLSFLAGPMCGINRTSAEPPCHYECAYWSAINCPFLSKPQMVRREDEQINNANLRDNAPGMAITRNPGVAMLWVCRSYECFDDGHGQFLIQMGEPERVEWYASGRPATNAEVMKSVRTGLPSLMTVAEQQEGGAKHLQECLEIFLAYVPPVAAPIAEKLPL